MNVFNKQNQKPKVELFAALDIGTSKVCCAIARNSIKNTHDGSILKVSGVGYQLSKGLRSGNIIDMEALEDSILNAVHGAEQAAMKNINSVYVSIPGRWIQSHHIRAELTLSNAPVDESHLRRLLTLHKDADIDATQHKILHVLPLNYEIDDVKGIIDPKGMTGNRLAVTLHVLTVSMGMIKNLTNCIGRCHLDIDGYVAAPYASSIATLVPDEMALGATMIDIGAGQTTIATFRDGNMTSTCTIPIGGMNITNDIARGLAAPIAQAERLKTLYGTLIPSSADDRENIMIAQLGETLHSHSHHIPKGLLVHIIRSRVEEIFELILQKAKAHHIDPLAFQCIVLTGGVSQLQGIREMAQTYFGSQVRLGVPIGISGSNDFVTSANFSTCAGLLNYACQDLEIQQNMQMLDASSSFWQRINHWIKLNF